MNSELLEQRFAEALELPASERTAFLQRTCTSDQELFNRLTDMIDTHERAERLAFFAPKAPFSAHEQPGQRIGPYLLRERLGEGGWGIVFLAEQEKPVRRRVALKVIKAGLESRSVIARFEAEREALARMDHPNIAKVLDAGVTDVGRPYFVMELVSGPRLTDYCDQKKLSVSDRLELFAKVCQALQHAHQKGIIHRDLKPSNILVADHDGVPAPRIIDFGIAKAIEGRLTDDTSYTGGPQLMGTPAYMSPEQTAAPNPDVDTRSDLYSLGVILYELLAGKTPFDSRKLQESTWEEMCRIIREKDPLRPSALFATLAEEERTSIALRRGTASTQLAQAIKGDLDWIVMKCLAKERARRYETASALALDVRRHLAAEPVIARPPSAAYRFQRLVVRNKLAFAATGAVGIALVAGLTTAIFGWRAARIERDRVERNLYAADIYSAAKDLDLTKRGHAFELLRKYRPAGREELRGWEWHYLWNICQTKERFTLTGHHGRVVVLAFTPDNKSLISGDTAGIVKRWDLHSMQEVGTCSVGRLVYDFGLDIAPDGQALFIAWRDGAAVYDSTSLTRIGQLPGAKGPLALSPDGRMLVTGGSDEAIIWDPGNLTALHRSTARQGAIPSRSTVSFSPDGRMIAIPLETEGRSEVKVWNAAALRENGFQVPPISVLQRGDTKFLANGMIFS